MDDDDKFKLTLITLIALVIAYLAYLHSKQSMASMGNVSSQIASLNNRMNVIQSLYSPSSSNIPIKIGTKTGSVQRLSPREKKDAHISIQRTMQDEFGCK